MKNTRKYLLGPYVKDQVPLIIAHGWGGSELTYAELRQEIAKRGKPAITWNSPRSKGWLNDLNLFHLSEVAKFSSQAGWGVLKAVKNRFGYEQVDEYGHSMGGETVVNLAIHSSEHVRAVILDGSCGLDFHTLQEMIIRTGEVGRKELLPVIGRLALSSSPRLGIQVAHYVFRNPGRTIAEGVNAGSTNLHQRLEMLGEQGIYRAAIQSEDDTFFPVRKVERDSRHLFDAFHIREDPSANHMAPQLDPAGTAETVIRLLNQVQPKPEPLHILDIAA
jgi:pimeloyl-ACP methyl ester carboxylesterase